MKLSLTILGTSAFMLAGFAAAFLTSNASPLSAQGKKMMDLKEDHLVYNTDLGPTKQVREHTSAPLQMVKQVKLDGSKEKVFAYFSNHDNLPEIVPGMITHVSVDNENAQKDGQLGAVRQCAIATPDGNKMKVSEEFVMWEDDKMFAYSVSDGNPFGLSEHLSIVSFKENGHNETLLTWYFYFDHKEAAQTREMMGGMISMAVNGLVKKFGGKPVMH